MLNCQFSRSREANRRKARELLALKIEELTAPPGESRNEIIANYKQMKARKKKAKSKKKYRDREEAQRLSSVDSDGDDVLAEPVPSLELEPLSNIPGRESPGDKGENSSNPLKLDGEAKS